MQVQINYMYDAVLLCSCAPVLLVRRRSRSQLVPVDLRLASLEDDDRVTAQAQAQVI